MGTNEQSENADQSENNLKSNFGCSKKNKQTRPNNMLSAIAMLLFSNVSTYSELGHIQNWKKKKKKSVLVLNLLIKCRGSKYVIKSLWYGQGVPLSQNVTG